MYFRYATLFFLQHLHTEFSFVFLHDPYFLVLHFIYLNDYLMQHEMTSSRFVRRSIQCALWVRVCVCVCAMVCCVVLCVLFFMLRIILTLSLFENPPLIFIRFIILFPLFIQCAIGVFFIPKLYHNNFFGIDVVWRVTWHSMAWHEVVFH